MPPSQRRPQRRRLHAARRRGSQPRLRREKVPLLLRKMRRQPEQMAKTLPKGQRTRRRRRSSRNTRAGSPEEGDHPLRAETLLRKAQMNSRVRSPAQQETSTPQEDPRSRQDTELHRGPTRRLMLRMPGRAPRHPLTEKRLPQRVPLQELQKASEISWQNSRHTLMPKQQAALQEMPQLSQTPRPLRQRRRRAQ